jgi:hypothetical protein
VFIDFSFWLLLHLLLAKLLQISGFFHQQPAGFFNTGKVKAKNKNGPNFFAVNRKTVLLRAHNFRSAKKVSSGQGDWIKPKFPTGGKSPRLPCKKCTGLSR